MSTDSDRQETVERHHHRKGPHGRRAIPKPVIILVALCLALLILIPVVKRIRSSGGSVVANNKDAPIANVVTYNSPSFTPALEVEEAHFDPSSGTIKGKVKNNSDRIYSNIEIFYGIRDRSAVDVGQVTASVKELGPHQSAAFQTTKLPPSGVTLDLKVLTGDPR